MLIVTLLIADCDLELLKAIQGKIQTYVKLYNKWSCKSTSQFKNNGSRFITPTLTFGEGHPCETFPAM